jgi:hypothetical protein
VEALVNEIFFRPVRPLSQLLLDLVENSVALVPSQSLELEANAASWISTANIRAFYCSLFSKLLQPLL